MQNIAHLWVLGEDILQVGGYAQKKPAGQLTVTMKKQILGFTLYFLVVIHMPHHSSFAAKNQELITLILIYDKEHLKIEKKKRNKGQEVRTWSTVDAVSQPHPGSYLISATHGKDTAWQSVIVLHMQLGGKSSSFLLNITVGPSCTARISGSLSLRMSTKLVLSPVRFSALPISCTFHRCFMEPCVCSV